MVIIDLETGRVNPPPLSVGKTGEDLIIIPNLGTGWGNLDFRLNSRLYQDRTPTKRCLIILFFPPLPEVPYRSGFNLRLPFKRYRVH